MKLFKKQRDGICNFETKAFGENTEYVVDPEKCMAYNFSYALLYGMDGHDGEGYKSPEIIEGIISILKEW